MATVVVLLRGINLGASNRIAMPALRGALTEAGFERVRTLVQSGNVLVDTDLGATEVTERVQRLVAERFGLRIPVVGRSREELARVVSANPFPELAETEPKRFQVSFVRGEIEPAVPEALATLATPTERVAVIGREIYAWHPDGVARSKLWARLGARDGLGRDVAVTSRNWTTVTTLLAMAEAPLQ